MTIYREIGRRGDEAHTLNHYAELLTATGNRPQALTTYHQALAMNRELNKPDDETVSLEGIGEHHLTNGDTERGIEHLRQALNILQRLGKPLDAESIQNRLTDIQ